MTNSYSTIHQQQAQSTFHHRTMYLRVALDSLLLDDYVTMLRLVVTVQTWHIHYTSMGTKTLCFIHDTVSHNLHPYHTQEWVITLSTLLCLCYPVIGHIRRTKDYTIELEVNKLSLEQMKTLSLFKTT